MRQREIIRHWAPGPAPFEVVQMIDFENGLTDAVVRADGSLLVLEMLAWGGPRFQHRVFRTSALPEDAFAVHQRNARSASCDLTRAGRELHALLTNATLLRSLVLLDVSANEVLALHHDFAGTIPMEHWRERSHELDRSDWFNVFANAA